VLQKFSNSRKKSYVTRVQLNGKSLIKERTKITVTKIQKLIKKYTRVQPTKLNMQNSKELRTVQTQGKKSLQSTIEQ
jgi:plasmid maintenance system antidote protein VapI